MTIGILQNLKKEDAGSCVEKLKTVICAGGADCFMLNEEQRPADLLISVGGDGTFLKAAARSLKQQVPVMGLNLGTLGLLTEFEVSSLEETVEKLLEGHYNIEQRSVLEVTVTKPGRDEAVFRDYAINDCVLSQSSFEKVAYIQLYIDGQPVEMYPCDGIIVATQTGSTAYSLSAGGPIVMPGCDVMLVTPKCPHFTDGRSIVAAKEALISMKLLKNNREMITSVDGRVSYRMDGDETVNCKTAEKKLQIVRIDPPNFFYALKKKIERREDMMETKV